MCCWCVRAISSQCDGVVLDGESQIDTSSLTGEAAPLRATAGTPVMSGTLNGLGSFRMRATAPAEQSQYARIVEMVRTAQASKAPLQRVADRYAVWFTPITVAVCAIAVWVTKIGCARWQFSSSPRPVR